MPKILPHISNKQIIVIALAGLAVIILLFFLFRKKDDVVVPPSSSDIIKTAIDSAIAPLKVRNDSLLRENDSLHNLISSTDSRNKSLRLQLAEQHNFRYLTKKRTDEKVSNIDKFTPPDIDSFVTRKYLIKQGRK